jgi:hypothetical protein
MIGLGFLLKGGEMDSSVIKMLVALVVFALGEASAKAQTSDDLNAIQRSEIEGATRSAVEQKIGSHLLDTMKAQQNAVGHVPTKKVDIKAKVNVNPGLLDSIIKLGGKISSAPPGQPTITAYVPLNRVQDIAAHPDVQFITDAAQATTHASRIDAEGRVAHAIDQARTTFGVDGSGIKVGIISDSIDNDQHDLKRAFAVGALKKSTLHIVPHESGEGTGEGLAMAEIVYAIAPGASIYFATGIASEAEMAANIRDLQVLGCKIIVDDVSWYDESPFQDGPISQAVADVTAKGVLYFSSARNGGNKKHARSGTWEGDFQDGGPVGTGVANAPGYRLHAFAPNMTQNEVEEVDESITNNGVDLFWADPYGKAPNEYHLYVVGPNGIRKGDTSVKATGVPYQYVRNLYKGDKIIITKAPDAVAVFLHLDTRGARLTVSTNGSVRGHNASPATNAFSVAAVRTPDPPGKFSGGPSIYVENFSADGPRRIFFHSDGTPITPNDFSSHGGMIVEKPAVAAADGITTSMSKESGLDRFFGTSAAAPHAAAIAALLWSFDKKATASEIRELLINSTLPIDGGRPNDNAGNGIVMAIQALEASCKMKNLGCGRTTPDVATSGARSR